MINKASHKVFELVCLGIWWDLTWKTEKQMELRGLDLNPSGLIWAYEFKGTLGNISETIKTNLYSSGLKKNWLSRPLKLLIPKSASPTWGRGEKSDRRETTDMS